VAESGAEKGNWLKKLNWIGTKLPKLQKNKKKRKEKNIHMCVIAFAIILLHRHCSGLDGGDSLFKLAI